MRGCAAGEYLDASQFSKPLPTIGLYIAGASLCCAAAMAVDAYRGFRSRRLWFPSRYFTLNAATLTLLAVATKLPVDLNTSMPRRVDQLSKLSGTVLICTVMGNLMPSLGLTDNPVTDIVALGILVVTVVVNVGIQIGTGVIYVYIPEHAVVVCFMLVLLILVISSALTVSATKKELERQYDSKLQMLKEEPAASRTRDEEEEDGGSGRPKEDEVERLRRQVKKYWLMAHTSSPQYVLGRSATCTAAGAFCLLSALVLIEVAVRSFVPGRSRFCSGTSDYRWSIILVFLTQAVAVVVGTIAPAIRWFNAISFRSPEPGTWTWREEFQVEKYWVEKLTEWKEAPLPFQIRSRRCLKITQNAKTLILGLLIKVQTAVVSASKLVRLVSIVPVRWLNCGTRLFRKMDSFQSSVGSTSDLSAFVLHLEGEDGLVERITRTEREDTEEWIHKGRTNKPTHLTSLVQGHSQPGFMLVDLFDSNEVDSLVPDGCDEPPHCWALPVVTLASIAVALPGVDESSLKPLLSGVNEGLRYVRLVEKNLEAKGLVNQRKAADILWSRLYIGSCWLDSDLRRLADESESTGEILGSLRSAGETCVREFLSGGTRGLAAANHLEWPPRVLAANCMYRLASTILRRGEQDLYSWLQMLIADLLGACLTNLPRAIKMESCCNRIEVMEEGVRGAALLLGEAEDIMAWLAEEKSASLYPGRRVYVDDWRENMSRRLSSMSLCSISTSASSSHVSFSVGESERSAELTHQQEQPDSMV